MDGRWVQIAALAGLPAALLLTQPLAGSLWKHAALFYAAMGIPAALFAWGVTRLFRGGRRRTAVALTVGLFVASALPVWYPHANDEVGAPARHGHTLWELVHVH